MFFYTLPISKEKKSYFKMKEMFYLDKDIKFFRGEYKQSNLLINNENERITSQHFNNSPDLQNTFAYYTFFLFD